METLFACEFIPTARTLAGRIKKFEKPRWIVMMVLGAALLGFMMFNIIASGGITTVDEVFELAKMNMFGAILGKAIYNGNIDLAEAVKAEKI